MAEVDGAKAASLGFRIAAVGLSVAAAVVMGSASQLVYGHVVSFSDYGAFVYFVVASVISAVGSAVALYLSAVYGATGSVVSFLDATTQGLLFSAAGAAFAVRGVVASVDGGGDWGSVCRFAGAFCGKVSTAATVCTCAAVAVSVAALTKDVARRSVSVTSGGGSCNCKHGCHCSHC